MGVLAQSSCVLDSNRIAQLLAVICEAAGCPGFLNGFEGCWKPLKSASVGKQPCLLQGNLGLELLALPDPVTLTVALSNKTCTSEFLHYACVDSKKCL